MADGFAREGGLAIDTSCCGRSMLGCSEKPFAEPDRQIVQHEREINNAGPNSIHQAFLQRAFDHDRFPTIDADGPVIFTALEEQLGLELESQKAGEPVLVIDHVEHPTED